jgi:hypothetical protein
MTYRKRARQESYFDSLNNTITHPPQWSNSLILPATKKVKNQVTFSSEEFYGSLNESMRRCLQEKIKTVLKSPKLKTETLKDKCTTEKT